MMTSKEAREDSQPLMAGKEENEICIRICQNGRFRIFLPIRDVPFTVHGVLLSGCVSVAISIHH